MNVSYLVNTDSHCDKVSGEFVSFEGERYYAIRNVDNMEPFFISLVSDGDHWLFIASNGGLTAGRVSPETALFPYITVDKLYESTPHTGSKTLIRVAADSATGELWEPFNPEQDDRYTITRNLYKNVLGNKLIFEEINHDLQLVFRYSWVNSESYGFARQCTLENIGSHDRSIELLDGLQNILPAGTPRFTQTNTSYLVDAYKWNELDEASGLAMFTLFSGITDRAEPCESLYSTTAFCLGFKQRNILLSSAQLDNFRQGAPVQQETQQRGIRGAYWVNASFNLAAKSKQQWQLVLNVEQSQSEALSLIKQLAEPDRLAVAINHSVEQGSDALARIMAAGDAFQSTAEEEVAVHHFANTQFNILRGGIVDNQYQILVKDFCASIKHFNGPVYQRHYDLLASLPGLMDYKTLLQTLEQAGDLQLMRLANEYLPITFGRRHGDPSRPWNQFEIKLKDEQGERLLSYQGNWRDIFQNWEALLLSYPEFIESVIGKFVSASTVDGYNPYRITKEGIDWEVEDIEDPWSYIGYWGDHQIIYLQKLLELSRQFHPSSLQQLLRKDMFSYANVPYKIKPLQPLLDNAKDTVVYDNTLADAIEQRVEQLGGDGKLLLDSHGEVYRVNLLEKLLVPLLSKLSNLVVDGGIWLNTQRPEWNDANNALVGQGLSMVTLYYMRRYIGFMQQLLAAESEAVVVSAEVAQWLQRTVAALANLNTVLAAGPLTSAQRFQSLVELGQAASDYRETVYQQEGFAAKVSQELSPIKNMLEQALQVIDHSISTNLRSDGLYHAYNVLELKPELQPESLAIDALYPMLEGQVAALSSGAIAPEQAVSLLETLFASDIFRADQNTFMLYPDRDLPGFLQKNCVPAGDVEALPLLVKMLELGDKRLIERDANGVYRFNPQLSNVDALNDQLDSLLAEDNDLYPADMLQSQRVPLQQLYEQVFNHKAFTGRSGGMFGFEGLGSIYWHMVSKLLLAVQENFFDAAELGPQHSVARQQLADFYYRVREGIGFNKTPQEYGAFPADPYSHTPKHMGAQQPGMTGQVKEEVIARFGELGIRVNNGAVQFDTSLLRPVEFSPQPQDFRYLDVAGDWQLMQVPANGLAFTWCQVPIIYRLDKSSAASLTVTGMDGQSQRFAGLALASELAESLFMRSGRIARIELVLNSALLLDQQ